MSAATLADVKDTIVDLRMLSLRVDNNQACRLLVSIEIALNNIRMLNKVSESVLGSAQRAISVIKDKIDTVPGIVDLADINTLKDIDHSLWTIFNSLYAVEEEG